MNLVAAGMVTAVGASAPASCAAIRAKIAGFEELPYADIRNRPVIGAPVRFIDSDSKGVERLTDLAVPALRECMESLHQADLPDTALLLGLGEISRPGVHCRPEVILRSIQSRLGFRLSTQSRAIAGGGVSTISALQIARLLFERRLVKWCVVGGVDSFLEREQLRWLEQIHRLKRPNNPDGLIPGEAACFVVVGPSSGSDDGIGVTGMSVQPTAQVSESTGTLPRGTELTAAMRNSMTEASIASIDVGVEITDMTGERDMGVDHAIAVTRTFTEPRERLHFWHLGMSVGSIGAASMGCAMGLARAARLRGFFPGRHAMCVALAEASAKGAVIISLRD